MADHRIAPVAAVAAACVTFGCLMAAVGTNTTSLHAATAVQTPVYTATTSAHHMKAIPHGQRATTFSTAREATQRPTVDRLNVPLAGVSYQAPVSNFESLQSLTLAALGAFSLSTVLGYLFKQYTGSNKVAMAAASGESYTFVLGDDGVMRNKNAPPPVEEEVDEPEDDNPSEVSEVAMLATSARKSAALYSSSNHFFVLGDDGQMKKLGAAAAPAEAAPAADAAAAPAPEAGAGKQEKKKKKKKKGPPPAPKVVINNGAYFDVRVGKIVEVGPHPDAATLYLEKIDVGEEEPRQIVSGLVNHVPIDQMQDAMVLVMCNLKPAKLRGILSSGMVMCASKTVPAEPTEPVDTSKAGAWQTPASLEEAKAVQAANAAVLAPPAPQEIRIVKLVQIPEGAKPGDKVSFPGLEGEPPAEMPKKRAEKLLPGFNINADGECCWEETPLTLESGVVTSDLKSASLG